MLIWVLIIIAIVLVILLGIGFLIALRRARAGVAPIPPQMAGPKTPAGCPPIATAPADNVTYQLKPTDTSGTISHQKIVLSPGVRLDITSSLTLVANDSIQIDSIIQMPGVTPGLTVPSPSVTLICKDGPIIIGPQGSIGAGGGQPGVDDAATARYALASAGPGQNGGNIYLEANVIVIQGVVLGHDGGGGGRATATGSSFGPFGGYATAIGAQSGAGGDVVLCAMEKMDISRLVAAGGGGVGGRGLANAVNGALAYAQGGPANDGGNVYLTGLGRVPCPVNLNGEIRGGNGGWGGAAEANGGNGAFAGGLAVARGGSGANGGTVLFSNVIVTGQILRPGAGGDGGDAEANGGIGGDATFFGGSNGGDATANGGDGGKDGPIPQPPGGAATGPARHSAHASAKGGDADATAGNGGKGGLFGKGGNSGSATAQGGAGTTGPAPVVGPTAPAGPLPATPSTGGVGGTASSPGAN